MLCCSNFHEENGMQTIELPHKVLDYSCPINGLEDQYEWKTGTRLPGYFLMDLSTIGFLYIRNKLAPVPRMLFWGSGMGKAQHEFLAEIIGYRWAYHEGGTFKNAWQNVLAQVHQGQPVIFGLLDMYHLPYFEKFYHRVHIPQHFLQVIGFDGARDAAIVLDNSLPEPQFVPLRDLQSAWNVNVPGQGKPFTCYVLTFGDQIATPQEIAVKGLKKRAQVYLNPPNSRLGCLAMEKAARDIPNWPTDLSEPQFKACLESLATFTCSVVPNLPQALLPFPLGYEDAHQACRDRFAAELTEMAEHCHQPHWLDAANGFSASGVKIGELTDMAVQTLQGKRQAFKQAGALLMEIQQLETKAFHYLANA